MSKDLNFLGLGFELGQKKSGLSESPDFMRSLFPHLNTFGIEVNDLGNVQEDDHQQNHINNTEELLTYNWSNYQRAYEEVRMGLGGPNQLINWGGDHSVGLSTVAAFLGLYPEGKVIWIDAHADLNLPQVSPSGNLHGMPVALLLNLLGLGKKCMPWVQNFLSPENFIYVGLRSIDPFEKEMIQRLGVESYDSDFIQKYGVRTVIEMLNNRVFNSDLHISFDIDSVNPIYAPSTGVPESGGLSPEQLTAICSELSHCKSLRSVDIVEVNPQIGNAGDVRDTFLIATNFIKALFSPHNQSNKGVSYDEFGYPTTPYSAS